MTPQQTVAPALPAAPNARRRAAGRLVDLVRRRPELVTTLLCAIVLAIGIRGPDLPAQNYRVWLLRTHGLIIFDSHWYAGHTLPAERLLAHVWGSRGSGDRQLLKQLVHRLRQKIEAAAAEPRYLVTISGLGYALRPQGED